MEVKVLDLSSSREKWQKKAQKLEASFKEIEIEELEKN